MNDSLIYEQNQEMTITKVFAWMGLGLLITFGVALGLAFALPYILLDTSIYLTLMIVAIVLMFVETFVLQYRVIKNHKSAVVPYIIYSVSMGIMMSSIILYTDVKIILLSLGTAALVFGLLALFGYISKKDLSSMGSVAAMVLIGGVIISLFNVLFFRNNTLYWIVSLATFGAFMLFTAFDMWRMNKIIQSGMGNRNLAIYCAFQLYIDFIYIFMRILELYMANSRN